MDLTARMERMEKRVEEAEEHRIRLEAKIDKAGANQERMEAKIDDNDDVGYHNTRDIRDVANQVKSKCFRLTALVILAALKTG